MAEKMVAVPQSLLDKIELSRQAIYDMHPEANCDTMKGVKLLSNLVNITTPLWEVANRNWKEVK